MAAVQLVNPMVVCVVCLLATYFLKYILEDKVSYRRVNDKDTRVRVD